MDRMVKRDPRQRWLKLGALGAAIVMAGALAWQAIPHGLGVKAGDIDVATVASGLFRDELTLRANAPPPGQHRAGRHRRWPGGGGVCA
jgi:HlyD family secretion protein